MARQKALFRWREPRAFAKERARRSRVVWTASKRLAFGFALGTVVFLSAIMRLAAAPAETPMPQRGSLDWIGIWLAGCVVMSALFWALGYVSQPRTLTIREKLLQSEKRRVLWNLVLARSWSETAGYGVLALLLNDGRVLEFGARLEDRLRIEEVLDRLAIPKRTAISETAPSAAGANVSLKFAAWLLIWTMGIAIWSGVGFYATNNWLRGLDADATSRAQIRDQIKNELKLAGAPAIERRFIGEDVATILFPPLWRGLAWAGLGFMFGGIILWSQALVWMTARKTITRRTIVNSPLALGILLVGACVFAVGVAKEMQWRRDQFAARTAAIERVRDRLAPVNLPDSKKAAIIEQLRQAPWPFWVTRGRFLIFIAGIMWLVIWWIAASTSMIRKIFPIESAATSPSRHR
jgi:predicted membrane protein